MDAVGILSAMRAGERPDAGAMQWVAAALASGEMSDAQAGAFAMAVCRNGLGEPGRVALTMAMRDSGDRLDWSDLPGPVCDKHSTGGIGDCLSLVLAPALAAAGLFNPMISGRGLGHSGGTLDKLEAIPGVATEVGNDRLREIVRDCGCAIVSASGRIAPADRRLYAVRDVTGTVPSIDLIVASILSKKLAGGIGALVLDVKTGSGAFMENRDDARSLARALVDTARGAGCKTQAFLTDMNQPLADAVGNAVEVAASMQVLTGRVGGRLYDLTLELGGACLALAGAAESPADGAARIAALLASGAAAERFSAMVRALGGPADVAESWRRDLPVAPVTLPVPAPRAGHVAAIDGVALGMAVVRLGGGRLRGSDVIDPAVGLGAMCRLGDRVAAGAPLAMVHAADPAAARLAAAAVLDAVHVADAAPAPDPLVSEVIS